MAQVSVTLVRADTNQEFDVELPDDANIRELLPALVKELGLPLTGPDGNQVAYELSNKRTGKEYKEDQTLGSAGTKTGDSLLLTSTFVAGVVVIPFEDADAADKGFAAIVDSLEDASRDRLTAHIRAVSKVLGMVTDRIEEDEPTSYLPDAG